MLKSDHDHNVNACMVFDPGRRLRKAPLAAALALLYAGSATANVRDVAMPPAHAPGSRAGVAALFQALREAHVHAPVPVHVPVVLPVGSCADDGGINTLRNVIARAGDGDTIDLSALTCSKITLAQGAIPAFPDHLTLRGPGALKLAIDGDGLDRVIVHYGYYSLRIEKLTLRNGYNRVSGYHVAGGACVLSNAYVTLDHSTVSGCRSIGEGAYGGAILARGIAMYTSTLSYNLARGSPLETLTASYGAGAFAYRGTAALYDSTVSGNIATVDPANTHGSYDTGAGIFTDKGGIALRSTIANNSTDGSGGGIASHAPFLLSDSTLSGNTAARGGGLFVRTSAPIALNNSTIAFNRAGSGAGIYLAGAPAAFELQSTLLASNTGNADLATKSALSISGANNLVGTALNVALPVDTLHGDPLLLALADNGGPTRTHALSVASPAHDAGNNVANLDSDQRGRARVVGAAADIGAVEMDALGPAPASVPLLSPWAAAALVGLFGGIGMRRARLRRSMGT
jgi:hypothetical protein